MEEDNFLQILPTVQRLLFVPAIGPLPEKHGINGNVANLRRIFGPKVRFKFASSVTKEAAKGLEKFNTSIMPNFTPDEYTGRVGTLLSS